MIFCMASMQFYERRKGKKVIFDQTLSNHNTRAIQGGREHRDELNDAAEMPLQRLKSATAPPKVDELSC